MMHIRALLEPQDMLACPSFLTQVTDSGCGPQTGEFWHQLEALAMDHQKRLFGRINKVQATSLSPPASCPLLLLLDAA